MEFVLTLPFVVILVAITIEWGWVMSQQAWIHAVARDASRWAVELDPNDYNIKSESASAADQWLESYKFDCDEGTCLIVTDIIDVLGRDALVVSVDVEYIPIFGLIPVPDFIHGESTYLLKYQSL